MSILAFEKFYIQWLEEMKHRFARLRVALKQPSISEEEEVAVLVQACHSHYCEYMNGKMKLCEEHASFVVAGMWRTPLEAGFLWMGGWRPTTAVVLAYSLMGIQIESELQKLLDGIELPTMAALSARQLSMLDSLQQKLRVAEDGISNQLAVLQMLLADRKMSEATSAKPPPSESNDLSDVRGAMEPKLAGLRNLMAESEKLRGETIQEILNILRPIQAGQYALAAYDITMAVKKLGNQREGNIQSAIVASGAPTRIRELVSQGDADLSQKALESGIDPSEADYDGRTPLDSGVELCRAAASASGDVALVKPGVDPNVAGYGHPTALHVAAAEGNPRILVREGADVLSKDRRGFTSLDEARASDDQATIPLQEDEVNKFQSTGVCPMTSADVCMQRQDDEDT